MFSIILVYMVVEGYHVLCSSCFIIVWVENLMCLLLICIESSKSTKEEIRDGNQYCLIFPLWWCVALLKDSWSCWERRSISGPLCNGEFQFPIVITAHLISLVVISFNMVHFLVHKFIVLSVMLLLSAIICFNDYFYFWGSISSIKSKRGYKHFCANVWSNWELARKLTLCLDAIFVKYFFPFVSPRFWHDFF